MSEHVGAIFVVHTVETEKLYEYRHSIGRDPSHTRCDVVHKISPYDIIAIANSHRTDIGRR
ncbi:hypothetical protein D3C87_1963660 [compost metagenome]